ncbi:MAG: hypothetical protein FJX57_20780, partial [Alphaproteobacteria bacterium]|nr:hypothetical protein [Alphaproteobacteria bacterium]
MGACPGCRDAQGAADAMRMRGTISIGDAIVAVETLRPRDNAELALILGVFGWEVSPRVVDARDIEAPPPGPLEQFDPGPPPVVHGPLPSLAPAPAARIIVPSQLERVASAAPASQKSGSGRGTPIVLQGHESVVNCIAVLPDGRIVSGSADGTVRVWDLRERSAPVVLKGQKGQVNALAVLYDGRVVSGSDDGTVYVWDPSGRGAPLALKGHESAVNTLAVLPDGRIVSGSYDRSVRVWAPGPRSAPVVLKGHGAWVRALAVL